MNSTQAVLGSPTRLSVDSLIALSDSRSYVRFPDPKRSLVIDNVLLPNTSPTFNTSLGSFELGPLSLPIPE